MLWAVCRHFAGTPVNGTIPVQLSALSRLTFLYVRMSIKPESWMTIAAQLMWHNHVSSHITRWPPMMLEHVVSCELCLQESRWVVLEWDDPDAVVSAHWARRLVRACKRIDA